MHPALQKEFKRKLAEAPADLAPHLQALFDEEGLQEQIPLGRVMEALNFPLKWVQTNALYELYRRREQPIVPLEKGAVLSIVGEISWPEDLLRPALEALGIGIAPLSESSTHVVLGFYPGTLPPDQISGVTLLMEDELLDTALHSPNFFLLHGERGAEIEKLERMLLSSDVQNVRLALGLIEKGGLPQSFFTLVFALWRARKAARIPELAGLLLKRYASGPLKKNLLRRYFAFATGDVDLLGKAQSDFDPEGQLDLKHYFRLNFTLSRSHELSSDFMIRYYDGLTSADAEERKEVVELMFKRKRLWFPQSTLHFPAEAYGLRGLRSLELEACPITRLPEGISRLDSLIKLEIAAPLTELPEDLAQCPKLRSIRLEDSQLAAFPSAFSQLKRLKILTWINSLADPEQTLTVPASFFQLPIQTLHLSERHIDLPQECFQSESLTTIRVPLDAATSYLEKLGNMPALQRLQLDIDPQKSVDWKPIAAQLPGWRLEDQKYNSKSFVRNSASPAL